MLTMVLNPFWLIDSNLQSLDFYEVEVPMLGEKSVEDPKSFGSQVFDVAKLDTSAPGFRESWGCEEGESFFSPVSWVGLGHSCEDVRTSCVRIGMGHEMMISSTQPVQWISLIRDNSILHDISYRPRQLRMLRKTAARTGICWISLSYDQTLQGRSTRASYCQHTCCANKMSSERRRNYVIYMWVISEHTCYFMLLSSMLYYIMSNYVRSY